jgi:hypothetical protein
MTSEPTFSGLDEDGDDASLALRGIVTEFVCRAEMRRNDLALAER